MEKSIKVNAVGSLSIPPDVIILEFDIQSQNIEYDKAISLAQKELEILNKTIEDLNIPVNDLKTINFNITTEYKYEQNASYTSNQIFNGYLCSYKLTLEIKLDLDLFSKIINLLVKNDSKVLFNTRFSVSNKEKYSEELLINTVNKTREKANIIAKASNVILGEIININYNIKEQNFYSNTTYNTPKLMVADNIKLTPEDIVLYDDITVEWSIL